MSFDVYKPSKKDEYIDFILDLPGGSLVGLAEDTEKRMDAVLDNEMEFNALLDEIQKRFDELSGL